MNQIIALVIQNLEICLGSLLREDIVRNCVL